MLRLLTQCDQRSTMLLILLLLPLLPLLLEPIAVVVLLVVVLHGMQAVFTGVGFGSEA